MLRRNRGFRAAVIAACVLIAAALILLFTENGKSESASNRKKADAAESQNENQTQEKTEKADDGRIPEKTGQKTDGQEQSDKQEDAAAQTDHDPETAQDEDAERETVTEEQLIVLKEPAMYTYEDMEKDIQVLTKLYPDLVQSDSLGVTPDGRELYHLVIGDENAGNRIFISAGIHAREYITCQLVMKQAAVFLKNLTTGASYGDRTYEELMTGSAIHVVPMINPDGIAISQFGLDGIRKESVLEQVKEIARMDGQNAGGSYLTRWKSNADGVDLNRNFDALWDQYNDGKGHPSSDHYKGTQPGCEPEAAALIRLTEEEDFSRTVSYHTQGGVIYWYFAQEGELYEKTRNFAGRIAAATGYYTDANYESLDPAGYKDWAISKCGIPSLTIEVGTENSPVPPEQMEEIWIRNDTVWEETLIDSKS